MTLDEIHRLNRTVQGRWLKFRADRLPVLFVIAVFAAQLAGVVWLPAWAAAAGGLLLLPLLGSVAIYNHHIQHHHPFNHALPNRLLEVIVGTQTMIPAYAWVLHHNYGHHPHYLNQPPCAHDSEDESRWARRDGSRMGHLEYTLNLLLRAPFDGFRAGRRQPRIGLYFLLMMIPYLLLQALLAWIDPVNYVLLVLLPAFCCLLYVYALTYEHHSGLHTDDPHAASRNRIGRLYNLRTCNLGYHTAHHLKPYLHWSLLPHYHALIAARIPAHCYVPCR